MKKWTQEDIEKLIEIYPNISNIDISKILGYSLSAINGKSKILSLKKNYEYKSNILLIRNKTLGRDLNIDTLKEIALSFKSRSEFQKMDASAYSTACRLGILDLICTHMIKLSSSIPQLMLLKICTEVFKCDILYNTRKIIKPYELDIYIKEHKIAFEYNGKYWHQNDVIDKCKICNKNDIFLITITETSRSYELDIKNQLISKIAPINKHCGLKLTSSDISSIDISDVYQTLYNEHDIINICNSYVDIALFKKQNANIYNYLYRSKKLNEYTKHMKKKIRWDIDLVNTEIQKYSTIGDFIKYSHGCYLYIKKNKLCNLLNKLDSKRKKRTLDESLTELEKYKTKYQLRKYNNAVYLFLKKKIGLGEMGRLLQIL